MGSDRTDSGSWIDRETDGSEFGGARLGERFRKLMGCLDGAIGQPIPLACEDWANTKAAYRFLSNASVSEEQILAGHCSRHGAACCEHRRNVVGAAGHH